MFFAPRSLFAALVVSAMTLTAAPTLSQAAAPASSAEAMGGVVHADRVQARTRDIYNFTLLANDSYMITVDGDGDTDLDLYVFDENGRLVASDTDLTDHCMVTITPRWTGPFQIVIVNNGRVYNDYVLRIR